MRKGLWHTKQKYARWLEMKNYTAASIEDLQREVGYFLKWCEQRDIIEVNELSKETLISYQKYLGEYRSKTGQPLATNTQRTYLKAVCGFCRWLARHNYVLSNPAEEIRLPVVHSVGGNVLSAAEVEAILNRADVTRAPGLRDRAMLETLYSCGVRASELVGLALDDVDLRGGTVLVRKGKGRKDRLIPLGERAARWIGKYLYEVRYRQRTIGGENTLFLTYFGKPFSAKGVGIHIRKYIKAARIGKAGACHIFRRTMATLMLQNGAEIRYIQEMLGHSQLSSTEIYTKVDIGQLKEVHKRTHPGEWEAQQASVGKRVRNRNFSKKPPGVPEGKRDSPCQKFWEQADSLVRLADEHLRHLLARGYSERAMRENKRRLMKFIQFCQDRGINSPGQVRRSVVERYQRHLYDLCKQNTRQPLSPGYRMLHLNNVKQFFKWLSQNNYIVDNPAIVIEIPKMPVRIPREILTHKEVEQVLAQPNVEHDTGIRDRAILETLYSSGMRRQELLNVEIENVDFQAGTILIVGCKGAKNRMVPVGQRALEWIEKYLREVRALQEVPAEQRRLFVNQYGQPMSLQNLSQQVSRYIKASGINKKGSCHLLRHSMATAMLENGADIRHIQEILGHADIKNTQIYSKVSIRKLKEVHSRTHPAQIKPTKTQEIQRELDESQRH